MLSPPLGCQERVSGTILATAPVATGYARTERRQVAFTPLPRRRPAARGTDGQATHPGWADTPGVIDALPGFHRVTGPVPRTPEQGADPVGRPACARPAPAGGRFRPDRVPRPAQYLPRTRHTDCEVATPRRYRADAVGFAPGCCRSGR